MRADLRAITHRWLIALAALIAAPAALAQITFVSESAPLPSSSAVNTVTAPLPGGVVANDVMLALVAYRGGNTINVASVPAGWTAVTSTNDGALLGMRLYQKVAGGSEPASYAWTLSGSDRAAVAILAFRGVDTSSPILTFGTRINGASTSLTAPSITPGVANSMLAAFWGAINGNLTFSAPASMVERVDVATGAGPNGLTLGAAYEAYAPTTATGTRVATIDSTQSNTGYLIALRPGAIVATPGGFNAFETSTASGAITGVIKTRIAGSASSLALVALNPARTAVLTTFTGAVTVELLDSADNSGALNATTGCRSSWTTIQTLSPNPSFTAPDNGRINVSFNQANAWRDVRVRVTSGSGGSAVIGCSSDNFAIRPDRFINLQATDADDSTVGSTRVLNNSSATTGVVHRAGRAFSVLAQAVSATGAATTGYSAASGGPTLSVASCSVPSGCTAGALSSTLSATSGSVAGTAIYQEAGVITVNLQDTSFAAVDAADSTLAERTIGTTSAAPFGRFIPDRYVLSAGNTAVLGEPLCGGGPSRQTFTFVGQPFAFATVPIVIATPVNLSGTALANARPRFTTTDASGQLIATGAPVALTGSIGVASVTQSATSQIVFDSGSYAFTRSATTPVASFTPTMTFSTAVNDTTETGTSGNGAITGTTSPALGPWAFAAGAGQFSYGRIALRPTYGDIRRDLFMPLEVLRYNGTGWVTATEMGACLSAPTNVFAYSQASGVLAASGTTPNCSTSVAATVTTSNGRASIRLPRQANWNATTPSSMALTLVLLNPASGQTCTAGVLSPASTLAMPWLAAPDGAGNYSANPSARLTFGRTRGDVVSVRERFD